MRARLAVHLALALGSGALLAGVAVIAPHRARTVAATPVLSEARRRDDDLAFYAARARRDPTGAFDLARMAGLYLQRARVTGDYQDVLRAEAMARRSLHNRSSRNAAAAQVLASSLLSQHRFADALEVQQRLVALEPERVSYRAALGEIQLELGRYDEARASFLSVGSHARELGVAPRLARWLEITGHPDAARHVLYGALREAAARTDLPSEQRSWFYVRVGDLELRHGQLSDAERALHAALEIHPGDYRALATLARLEAVRGRWRAAIEAGERAIATYLDPATLGTMSDAYLAMGDSARAEEYARVLEVAVRQQPGAYHRAWSLFLLDRGRRVDEVLTRAREELRSRRDIYGYDVVAWALYRERRFPEASAAMRLALSQGTEDAMLLYHAGMIALACGDRNGARRQLERALAIDRWWHPTQPAAARAVLDSLRRESTLR